MQVQRLSLLDHTHLVMFRSDRNYLMSKFFLVHLIILTGVLEAGDEAGSSVMWLELLHARASVFVRMLLHLVMERRRQL